jgi:hypothetical protein
LEVFIAPTTKTAVGEDCCRWTHWTVRCATGHCLVRQPRHPIVRVLTVSTVGALTSWATGRSGAPSGDALTLRELSAHCSVVRRPLESTVALGSRCSAITSDSPVTHRTVWWIIAERGLRNPKVKSLKSIHPGHRTVRCTRPGFTSVSFAPSF